MTIIVTAEAQRRRRAVGTNPAARSGIFGAGGDQRDLRRARQRGPQRQRAWWCTPSRSKTSIQCTAARNPSRRERRARLSADVGAGIPRATTRPRSANILPVADQLTQLDQRQSRSGRAFEETAVGDRAAAEAIRARKWTSSEQGETAKRHGSGRVKPLQAISTPPIRDRGAVDARRGRSAVRDAYRNRRPHPANWPRS